MSNRKSMYVNSFNVGFIKKIQLNKMSYFPEAYTHSKSKMAEELDLSNYATKCILKMQQVLIKCNRFF